MSSSYNDT